jgi:hypothetical protein
MFATRLLMNSVCRTRIAIRSGYSMAVRALHVCYAVMFLLTPEQAEDKRALDTMQRLPLGPLTSRSHGRVTRAS